MLFPVIRIKSKMNPGGKPRIVGTNSHDVLEIDEMSGGIQYFNLQCSESTKKYDMESSYEFVGEVDDWSGKKEIEFVTFEELAALYLEQTKRSCEQEKKLQEFIRGIIEKHDKIVENSGVKNPENYHTGGTLI